MLFAASTDDVPAQLADSSGLPLGSWTAWS